MHQIYKRRNKLSAAMLLAAGVITLWQTPNLKADEPSGPGDDQQMSFRGDGPEGHKDWKEKLGLSDEQSKKLEAIRTAEKAEMKPMREKMHGLRETLKGQVDAKAGDKEIKATLDELNTAFESMQAAGKKYRDQRNAILTPTQQAQSLLFKTEQFGRHDHKEGHEMQKEHAAHEDKPK